jgi:hypothetical protein
MVIMERLLGHVISWLGVCDDGCDRVYNILKKERFEIGSDPDYPLSLIAARGNELVFLDPRVASYFSLEENLVDVSYGKMEKFLRSRLRSHDEEPALQ